MHKEEKLSFLLLLEEEEDTKDRPRDVPHTQLFMKGWGTKPMEVAWRLAPSISKYMGWASVPWQGESTKATTVEGITWSSLLCSRSSSQDAHNESN